MNRIISKEEEREDPRRDSSIYLRVQWCFPHSYKNYKIPSNTVYSTVFLHAIQQLQVILHTELILPQEILQLQGSSRAGTFQQLFPVSPSILHGRIRLPDLPTAFQGHTAQAGFQQFYPAETAFYTAANIHAVPTAVPRPSSTLQNSTRRNRIHSKRVKYCMSMQY